MSDEAPLAASLRTERWGDLDVLRLEFPASAWSPNEGFDDPLDCLHGPTVVLNGVPMHMEAWRVTYDDDGVQRAAPNVEDEFEKLFEAVHGSGSFTSMTIGGHEYVVVLSPHC